MSLKSNLIGRLGEKGELAAKREAIEILVLENQGEWDMEIQSLKVAVRKANNAVAAASCDGTVTGGQMVRLQRTATAVAQDLTALQEAYATRFAEEA